MKRVIFLMATFSLSTGYLNVPWMEQLSIVRYIWNDCTMNVLKGRIQEELFKNEYFPKVIKCMQNKSLVTFDRLLDSDVIPIYNGIDLIRINDGTTQNDTQEKSNPRKAGDEIWSSQILEKISSIFETHAIKFQPIKEDGAKHFNEARRRRRQMMPIMLFGTVAMAMVLIPMGFKFLAVLGGKALLLAKMALLLASIQGLKRVATSGINYGLYHVPPHANWHDRHGRIEQNHPYVFDHDSDAAYSNDITNNAQLNYG